MPISNTDHIYQKNIYHGFGLRKKEIYLLALSFLILFVIPFFIGFYRTIYGYAQFGLVAAKSWGIQWFLISISSVTIILTYGSYRFYYSRIRIYLHPTCIVIKRPLITDLVVSWDKVTDLYVCQEATNSRNQELINKCVICTHNKRVSLRSSNIDNLLELITRIKSSIYIHLFPKIQHKFISGVTQVFGPIKINIRGITISRYGLKFASKQIFWKEIDTITIKSGFLFIFSKNGKIYRLRTSKIPNLEILLKLIENKSRGYRLKEHAL